MTHQDILRDFPIGVALIKAEEGFRATPYKCTAGAWTVGYGTNLDARGLPHDGIQWTEAEAEDSLIEELVDIVAALDSRYPRWDALDPVRIAVILSAVYQLGIGGAASFHNTITKIKAHDWDGAAEGLLASRWAKQTPERVKRNAEAIRTGKLPEVVNGVRIFDAEADGGMVQTQGQSAPSLLPTMRPGMPEAASEAILPPVSTPVPSVPLTVGGIVLSKKLCVAIVAFLAVILNEPLHIGMDYGTCKELVTLACSYILGQAGVDAFKPFASAILKAGAK